MSNWHEQQGLLLSLVLWTAFWLLRFLWRDVAASVDGVLVAALELCLATGLLRPASDIACGILGGHALLLLFIILTLKVLLPKKYIGIVEQRATPGTSSKPWATPAIIPSRTSHTRLTPTKHTFDYSYLLVGVPVGWSGRAGMLAIDANDRALFSIKASDYLERTNAALSLREKLDRYLEDQGHCPNHFPLAYLITAPRVLGYSFNPVSFWYLFSAEREVKAMILEVNNTFDERRLYFLEGDAMAKGPQGIDFSVSWRKDFHVSPFNDREGSYTLRAQDLGVTESDLPRSVSNRITLVDNDGTAKLVARVFSEQAPIDAATVTYVDLMWLFLRYGWTGFITFPRILREAWKLYFKRRLEIWFRPEVRQGTLGRSPTHPERIIESLFESYLHHCVKHYQKKPLQVHYKPASGMHPRQQFFTSGGACRAEERLALSIEVLTPAFYSRLVHYKNMRDAIRGEALCSDVRNKTLFLSDWELTASILDSTLESRNSDGAIDRSSFLDSRRWDLLRLFRCGPPSHGFPEASAGTSPEDEFDSKVFTSFDCFAMSSGHSGTQYRRCVSMLFLAERYAMGLGAVIGAMDLILRTTIIMISLILLARSSSPSPGFRLDQISGSMLLLLVHSGSLLKS